VTFWDNVKKDLQKEIKAGVTMVKEGAAVVKKKAGELTEEGKNRYKIFELKNEVHKWIAELGGKVYELSSKVSNPKTDKTVKSIITRIRKLESQISKLEGKSKIVPKKKSAKLTARSKKVNTLKSKIRK